MRRRDTVAGIATASVLAVGAFLVILVGAASRPGPDGTLHLSGGWKTAAGDDPAWAGRDFDDSSWAEVRAPAGWGRRHGEEIPFSWFRRTVVLDADNRASAARGTLGLTVGKVDSAYEVFAGGIHLGGVGGLPPRARVEYDRHRTYRVPPEAVDAGGRLVVAVRAWNSPVTNARVAALVEGPFLLGPLDALVRRELLAELPELVLAVLFLVIGLYHLQLHRRRPELREYLWFGVLAMGAAAYVFLRTQWKYLVVEDFNALKEAEHSLLFLLAPLYISFLFPFLSLPIPRALRAYQLLNLAGAAVAVLSPGLWLNLRMLTLWEYGALVFTPYALWSVFRSALRGHPEGRTIAVGVLLLSLAYLNDTAVDLGWYVVAAGDPVRVRGLRVQHGGLPRQPVHPRLRRGGRAAAGPRAPRGRPHGRAVAHQRRPPGPHARAGRRGGGEDALPRQREPRDPHAHERDRGHGPPSPGDVAGARPARVRRHHRELGAGAAADHRRHPRLVEDRGGGVRPRRGGLRRAPGRGRGGPPAAAGGGGEGPHHLRHRGPRGARWPRAATPAACARPW